MPKDLPFEPHASRYEAWFEAHGPANVSELLALRAFVPLAGRGLEIGVGSGRFAAPLGIQVGVDPSPATVGLARSRGVQAVQQPVRPGRGAGAFVVAAARNEK